eukprot:756362-Hanusia_phi.AAC.2
MISVIVTLGSSDRPVAVGCRTVRSQARGPFYSTVTVLPCSSPVGGRPGSLGVTATVTQPGTASEPRSA